jgi:hypothetical protein
MDKKLVIFYSNDLALTPLEGVHGDECSHSVHAVRGLSKLERWTGEESLHRTVFMAPAIVVCYNIFMNAVDRVDQRRATNPTRRREYRVYMVLFTYFMDLALNNAHALYQCIDIGPDVHVGMKEFKRRICKSLTVPHLETRKKRKKPPSTCNALPEGQVEAECTIEAALGDIRSLHVLTDTIGEGSKKTGALCPVPYCWNSEVDYIWLLCMQEGIPCELLCCSTLLAVPAAASKRVGKFDFQLTQP